MQKLLKLGLFVAAGYGTYEILRRAGLLYKAGEWLQDNVPEEIQAKVRDHVQQTRDQAQRLRGQAADQFGAIKGQATGQLQNLKSRAGERYDQAKGAVANKWSGTQQPVAGNAAAMQPPVENGDDSAHTTDPVPDAAHQSGQTITGPGRGVDDATVEVNGGSVHHRVGRGVVHG